MADATAIVVNPTGSEISNINTEGEDVPAYSCLETVNPLSDAEKGTVIAAGALVMDLAATSTEERRLAAKILKLGRNPGSSTAEQ